MQSALTLDESELLLRNLQMAESPTIEQARNAALAGLVLVPGTPDHESDTSLRFFAGVGEQIADVVSRGRLFDLGHLPQNILRAESKRATQLLLYGHIGHPFREPYAIFHTWHDPALNDGKIAGSIYVIDPSEIWASRMKDVPAGSFMVVEAEVAKALGKHVLLVANAAIAGVQMNADGQIGYLGRAIPSALLDAFGAPHSDSTIVHNLFDPVCASLLLLATDGLSTDRIAAPEKLNKHRVKAGKLPIPAHWRVNTGPYVTALETRGQRRTSGTGDRHHASPVPHLRRGHVRHLHERHGGGTTWVRDAVVNLTDPDAPLARSFYAMQKEKHQ